jgi:hypothetical protein
MVCAGGNFAERVFLRYASSFAAGAGSFHHAGAFLAGYSTYAYLHAFATSLLVGKDCTCLNIHVIVSTTLEVFCVEKKIMPHTREFKI